MTPEQALALRRALASGGEAAKVVGTELLTPEQAFALKKALASKVFQLQDRAVEQKAMLQRELEKGPPREFPKLTKEERTATQKALEEELRIPEETPEELSGLTGKEQTAIQRELKEELGAARKTPEKLRELTEEEKAAIQREVEKELGNAKEILEKFPALTKQEKAVVRKQLEKGIKVPSETVEKLPAAIEEEKPAAQEQLEEGFKIPEGTLKRLSTLTEKEKATVREQLREGLKIPDEILEKFPRLTENEQTAIREQLLNEAEKAYASIEEPLESEVRNAIQEQSTTAVPVEEPSERGAQMGEQVRSPEEPAIPQAPETKIEQTQAEVKPEQLPEARAVPAETLAEQMAQRANQLSRQVAAEIKVVQRVAKSPKLAKALGIDSRNLQSIRARVAELKAELARWKSWEKHPDLVAKVKASLEPPSAALASQQAAPAKSLSLPAAAGEITEKPPAAAGGPLSVKPSSQALGIVPPHVVQMMKLYRILKGGTPALKKAVHSFIVNWIKPSIAPRRPVELAIEYSDTPRMPPLRLWERLVEPRLAGRLPLAGPLLDPRFRAVNNPVQRTFVAYANMLRFADAVGNIAYAKFFMPKGVLKYKSGDPNAYIEVKGKLIPKGDAIEAYMVDPENNPLPEPLAKLVPEIRDHLDNLIKLMAEEGIEKAEAIETVIGLAKRGGGRLVYFPRVALGKKGVTLKSGIASGSGATTPIYSREPGQLKTRYYATEAEGIADGMWYMGEIGDIMATVTKRAYRAIATKRLLEAPSLGGLDRTQYFFKVMESTFPRLDALKKQINGATSAEQLRTLDKAYAQTLEDIRKKYPDLVKEIQQSTMRRFFGEVPGPDVFRGRIYPREVAAEIKQWIEGQPHKVVQAIKQFSMLGKTTQLALDVSFTSINTLPVLVTKPSVYFKSMAEAFRALIHPDYLKRLVNASPEHRKAIQEMAQLGFELGRLEDIYEGLNVGTLASRLPLFKQAGAAFGAALDWMRVESWLAVRDLFSSPNQVMDALKASRELEDIWNVTGTARVEASGVHRPWIDTEAILFRAAKYYRAALNLIGGMALKGSTGQQMRRTVGRLIGLTVGTSYVLNKLAGVPDDQIWRRFSRGNFNVVVKFGNRRVEVGLNHMVLSYLKLALTTMQYVRDDQRLFEGGAMRDPILRWFWAHSQVPDFFLELFLGQDYLGNRIQRTKFLLDYITPISVQQALSVKASEPVSVTTTEFGGALFGLNVYPESYRAAWWRIADQKAKEKYGKPYRELSVARQGLIAELANRDKTLPPKEGYTARQHDYILEMAERRVKQLHDAMPEDMQKVIDRLGLQLGGWNPMISVKIDPHGPTLTAMLTADQQKLFASILAQLAEEKLRPLIMSKFFQSKQPAARQKEVDNLMQDTRKQARGLFIRQWNEKVSSGGS